MEKETYKNGRKAQNGVFEETGSDANAWTTWPHAQREESATGTRE